MKIMEYLKNDLELKQLKEEWKVKFTENFPPYNYDEYNGIDDYKQKIKNVLESGDYKQMNRIATKFQEISTSQK